MAKRVCWTAESAVSRCYAINWIGCYNIQPSAKTWDWQRANVSKNSLPVPSWQIVMYSFTSGSWELPNEADIGQAHISRLVWQPVVHSGHELAGSLSQRLFCLAREGYGFGNSDRYLGSSTIGDC